MNTSQVFFPLRLTFTLPFKSSSSSTATLRGTAEESAKIDKREDAS